MLPLGHHSARTPAGRASRPARRSAGSMLVMLLATVMLLGPLSACGPTDTAGGTEVAGDSRSVEQTSAAPVDSPTPEESTPAETAGAETPSAAPEAEQATATPTVELTPEAAGGTALAMLASLEEKGRAPKTGYDRDSFGWRDDIDRNGCDTRNDILRRDLHSITLKTGTDGCLVLRGTLDSPYSGDTIAFDRADSTVDIDHVVALSDAWQTGAASWEEGVKREFANDPMNLLAVEASLNRQKGAGDAATWLPPKRDYRCEYVSRQIAVKDKYGLWVKPAEADAMGRVLEGCEGFLAVVDDDPWPTAGAGDVVATEAEPAKEPTPAPTPTPAPKVGTGSSAGGDTYFKNCDAARSAGAAPVRVGDPGYRKGLDRDGDGVGCE